MMIPAATLLLVLSARTVTLEEAERAAAAQRPDIRQADAAVAAGVARDEQARAPLLPQVRVEGLYERTTGNFATRPGVLPQSLTTSGMGVSCGSRRSGGASGA